MQIYIYKGHGERTGKRERVGKSEGGKRKGQRTITYAKSLLIEGIPELLPSSAGQPHKKHKALDDKGKGKETT